LFHFLKENLSNDMPQFRSSGFPWFLFFVVFFFFWQGRGRTGVWSHGFTQSRCLTGGEAKMAKCLPSKCEILSSNPSTDPYPLPKKIPKPNRHFTTCITPPVHFGLAWLFLRWDLVNYLSQTCILPILASQVARITGVSHGHTAKGFLCFRSSDVVFILPLCFGRYRS
jgi:hypothetical protein